MTLVSVKAHKQKLGTLSRQRARRATKHGACCLLALGWNKKARDSLQRVLSRGAGLGLPVVFDFDNTIIAGDIGEAVLAVLANSGRLRRANISKSLCPAIQVRGKGARAIADFSHIMEYYEAFLNPTVHGEADPTPLANGYIWATQVLESLTVSEVIQATREAFQIGLKGSSERISAGRTSYPAPRFHEEMVELIAELIQLGYEPWIVSASNVWSVRWMVAKALNPLLARRKARKGIPAEHVIGLATLLEDSKGRLYKDSVLVRQDSRYAALQSKRARTLCITRHVQFPAPVYSGKVACILDAIGRNPYLCAGDSPSDHPMLVVSENKLWIARPEKHEAQRATRALIRRTGKAGWILQTCAAGCQPGLVSRPVKPELL